MYISKRKDIMKTKKCINNVLAAALVACFVSTTSSAIGFREIDPWALGAGLAANYVGEVFIAPRLFNNAAVWDNGLDALTDEARKRGGAFLGSPTTNSLDAADINAKVADAYLQGKINSTTHDYLRTTRSTGNLWAPAPGTLYEEYLGKAQKNTPKTLFEPYHEGYKFLKSAFDDKTPASTKIYDDQVRAEALVSFLTAWKEGPKRALTLGAYVAENREWAGKNYTSGWRAGLGICSFLIGAMREWNKSGINGWHKILLPTLVGFGAGILAKHIEEQLLALFADPASLIKSEEEAKVTMDNLKNTLTEKNIGNLFSQDKSKTKLDNLKTTLDNIKNTQPTGTFTQNDKNLAQQNLEELIRFNNNQGVAKMLDANKNKELIKAVLCNYAGIGLANLTIDQVLPTKVYKALSKDLNANKIYGASLEVAKNIIKV